MQNINKLTPFSLPKIHIAFWIVAMFFSLIDTLQQCYFLQVLPYLLLVWVMFIVLFYLNYYLFTRYFKSNLILTLLLSLLLVILANTLYTYIQFSVPVEVCNRMKDVQVGSTRLQFYWFYSVFNLKTTLLILVSVIVLFYFEQKRKTEMQQKDAEIHYLKYQLSPHFLVNSINSLISKSVVSKKNITPDLIDLADWINYSLYETNKPCIVLKEEINQMIRFVNNQKEKGEYGNVVTFESDISDDVMNDFQIAPLLFFNFIENAFKYSMAQFVEGGFLRISLQELEHNKIQFRISNSIATEEQRKGKLGLENVQKRLDMIYKNNYKLSIEETDKKFSISLLIESL